MNDIMGYDELLSLLEERTVMHEQDGYCFIVKKIPDSEQPGETLIITTEFDYLRLECEAYARKLARCGVKTKSVQYNGTNLGFLDKIGVYPQAEDCIHEIAEGIRMQFR